MSVQIIAAWDTWKLIEEKEALLVDLRSKECYEESHICGAVSMPYEGEFDKYKVFDGKQVILLYCERGNTSLLVGKYLGECGYCVYTISGGFQAYKSVNWKKQKVCKGEEHS